MMSALPFLKSTIPDLAAFLGGNSIPLEKDQKQQMQDRGKDKAGPKSP